MDGVEKSAAPSLRVFSAPASVAIVGASPDPAKWGYWLARGALRGQPDRGVYLVNKRGATIDGMPSRTSLAEVPTRPELVAICVPPAAVERAVDDALDAGARGILIITAGLAHMPGKFNLEAELATRARKAGARVLGPNSLGLFDAQTDVQLAWGAFEQGSIGIVSQSGQVGLELAHLAARKGLGISRFVSVGSQVDVSMEEVLRDLADHEETKVVLAYAETFNDGLAFLDAASALRDAGKSLIVLTVGTSEAGVQAARSHTGALTSGPGVVDAACRAVGAARVATPRAAVDLAQAAFAGLRPLGPRLGIVTDSGGHGAVAADVASNAGLTVPALSPDVSAELAGLLPRAAATGNPVDLAGGGEQDLTTYHRVAEAMLDSGEVDAVAVSGYFGQYGHDTPSLATAELDIAERLVHISADADGAILVHGLTPESHTCRFLSANGIPVYGSIDAAMESLAAARTLTKSPTRGAPVPAVRPPHGEAVTRGYDAARDLLTQAGIAFPHGGLVSSADASARRAAALQAPLVLKADGIAHKSERGAIALDLETPDEVAAAYEKLGDRLGLRDFVVEELDCRDDVVELIVGARWDATFGPIIMVGMGGTEAELYRDTTVDLCPVTPRLAEDMIRRLTAFPLLDGWRGRPACDLVQLTHCISALSSFIVNNPPVRECEINPLRVSPTGALAVDALITQHC